MLKKEYKLKVVIGSISVELAGPKEFVKPFYDIIKPILEKEVQSLSKDGKRVEPMKEEKPLVSKQFPKKASLSNFYEEKKPSSDIQAAVVIAFFYSEIADPEERVDYINTDLLVKGIKLCKHPFPENPGQTLRNAKNYGYLDSTGERGKFKLTPTGYNLAAHTLPASES